MSGAKRILVAGLGARAQLWLKILAAHDHVEIVGLADPDPIARSQTQDIFPDLPVDADFVGLTQRVPADAALLVTPPHGRAAQIDACLTNGLHILAEKPLADTIREADQFVAAAEMARCHLIVGLNFRYLAVTQAMRQVIESRRFGAPEIARFTYDRWRDGRLPHLNSYPLTMAHPMLWEQSIHHFDLMRYVYDRAPARIFARTSNPDWSLYRDDTNIAALIEFEDGPGLTYQGTWQGGREAIDFEWRTDCETGVVIQRDMFGDLVTAGRTDADFAPVDLPQSTPWQDDARALLDMFVDTLNGAPARCTGRDHLASLAMLEATIRSSERGAPVELAEIHTELSPQPEEIQP